MPGVYILTLGCSKNTVASRRLEKALISLDVALVDTPETAQAIIVNTCGFIDAAKEESIEFLLDIAARRSTGSGQKIIAIGCLAERYGPELTKAIPEVDRFLGLGEINFLPELLGVKGPLNLDFQAHEGQPSAYLEISDGCNHKCSFCAIPAIRGEYRSRPLTDILNEAAYLAENGCRELVIVGQDTGVYGYDLKTKMDLPALLGRLDEVSGIEWIRLMYLQPQHLSGRLISELAGSRKVCRYLDIPFQHASPRILKAMNRWGEGETYLRIIEKLRKEVPGIALRTSVIVGFPGETQRDIDLLADFLKAARLDYVGVFEFSAQEGTAAAKMASPVTTAVKRARADRIRLLADRISAPVRRRFIGAAVDALIETENESGYVGRTRYQAPGIDGEIILTGKGIRRGDVVQAKITSAKDYDLIGVAVDEQLGQ